MSMGTDFGYDAPINNSMPNQDIPMNGNDMNDDDENGFNGSNDGFDAGVDADSDTDPKKYIQQLTGKLSQELRTYNNDQGTPDTELNKYVAGMIIPQATDSMTDGDKKDVINKVKKGVTDDEMLDSNEDEPIGELGNANESKKNIDNIINEIMSSYLSTKNDKERKEKKITNDKVKKSRNLNPFVCNI